MKYYLIVGEASGDLHASNLMRALQIEDPAAEFRFFGGDQMQAVGGTLVKHYREMAYMGFVQVIKHLPSILSLMRTCCEDIKRNHPDVVILVDYPSFNLKVAKYVKQELGIPVHYYIAPKLWAWKAYRIKSMKAYVDKVWSILPFEPEFFAKYDYPVTYVGNPTVDELLERAETPFDRHHFLKQHGLTERPVVAVLAGSRKAEVKANLPIMLEALQAFEGYEVVIAGAPGLDEAFYREVLGDLAVKIVFGSTFTLLQAAYVAVVTSGTATLEAAVLGVPQVVCYHMGGGKLLYKLMERVLKVPYVSLVNLILDSPLLVELLGYRLNVTSLRLELERLLQDQDYRAKIQSGYRQMLVCLGGAGAAHKAAQGIVNEMMIKNN